MEKSKGSKKTKKTSSVEKPIIVLNQNNKVQMAKPLYLQLTSPTANLSLTELKLIDVYLAAINSHKPEDRVVVFEKGALENLFGVKRIQKTMLDECFQKLIQAVVVISSEETNEERTKIDKASFVLFKRASLTMDMKDGLWKVVMECGEEAAQLIFNIDKIGYLQHPLASSAKLKSRNSYMVLKFIESHRNNKGKYPQVFEVSFDDLREQLGSSDKYIEWRDFRRAVLLTAQTEIHEKTDTRFEFEPIRVGRKIQAVRFTILPRVVANGDADAKIDNLAIDSLTMINDNGAVRVIDTETPPEDIVVSDNKDIQIIVSEDSNVPEDRQHYYYNNSHDKLLEKFGLSSGEVFTSEKYDKSSPIAFLAAACKNEFSPSKMQFAVRFIGDFIQDENEQYDLLSETYSMLNRENITDSKERFNRYRVLLANKCEGLIKDGGIVGQQYEPTSPAAFFGAACKNEFSPGEMAFLLRFIGRHIKDEYSVYNYLKDVYIRLNEVDSGQVASRYNYFRTMVANDEELLIQMGCVEQNGSTSPDQI